MTQTQKQQPVAIRREDLDGKLQSHIVGGEVYELQPSVEFHDADVQFVLWQGPDTKPPMLGSIYSGSCGCDMLLHYYTTREKAFSSIGYTIKQPPLGLLPSISERWEEVFS